MISGVGDRSSNGSGPHLRWAIDGGGLIIGLID